jgi:hypothetical protein
MSSERDYESLRQDALCKACRLREPFRAAAWPFPTLLVRPWCCDGRGDEGRKTRVASATDEDIDEEPTTSDDS